MTYQCVQCRRIPKRPDERRSWFSFTAAGSHVELLVCPTCEMNFAESLEVPRGEAIDTDLKIPVMAGPIERIIVGAFVGEVRVVDGTKYMATARSSKIYENRGEAFEEAVRLVESAADPAAWAQAQSRIEERLELFRKEAHHDRGDGN